MRNKRLIEIAPMEELRRKDSLTLQKEAIELNRASNISIVELGKRLIVLKEQCLKHSEYMNFIKEKLNLDYNIASKYVRLVKKYALTEADAPLENVELVTTLGVKKATKLLKISNLEERLKFIKDNDLVNKSYREIEELLNKSYPTEIKAIDGYSLYTTIHKSLKSNLEALTSNKDILEKNVEVKAEMEQIERQLNNLVARIETLKDKLEVKEEIVVEAK
ncbi:MAG: DUF3102 domain-containing protein [Clostridium sp.]|nr:DUF3102 domain-containing protein [Clostridium sp.]